jgi:hypothetical protein
VLRVAFDLDGTLADMDQVLRRKAAELFPPTRTESETAKAPTETGESEDARGTVGDPPADPTQLDLSTSQWRRLWAHVRRTDDFWLSLPEIDDGIVADIAALALERRWEVVFLTTRPPVRGQTTQVQSQKWLQAHGFAMPSVFVVQRSRGLIAQALELEAVVDDRLENCVDVALESTAVPILIRPTSASASQKESRPIGVRVVASIREAVAMLQQIDDERRPGVVRSIRKWLGR